MTRIFSRKNVLGLLAGLAFMAGLMIMPAVSSLEVRATTFSGQGQTMAETVTITGKVKAVDGSTLTILDDQKAEHSITLDPATKITRAGKDATAADIKANDSVVVIANKGEGGALTAVSIKAP
jgi:hypothetical protein